MELIAVLTCLAAILGGSSASAGILGTHAFAGALTQNNGIIGEGVLLRPVSSGPLDTGLQSFYADDRLGLVVTSSARAMVGTDPEQFLKVSASASATQAHLFTESGRAQAVAGWRDIAYVDPPPGAKMPSSVRLTFRVDGLLAAEWNGDPLAGSFPSNLARFGVTTTTSPFGFFDDQLGFYPSFEYQATVYRDNKVPKEPISVGGPGSYGTWDSFSFDGSTFLGVFHIDSRYDPGLGGYGWGLNMSSLAEAAAGSASSNFLNTLSLESVTLADGTPVAVTFDSGLAAPNAVPEPGSLLLAGIGMTLGVLRLRRKNKSPAV